MHNGTMRGGTRPIGASHDDACHTNNTEPLATSVSGRVRRALIASALGVGLTFASGVAMAADSLSPTALTTTTTSPEPGRALPHCPVGMREYATYATGPADKVIAQGYVCRETPPTRPESGFPGQRCPAGYQWAAGTPWKKEGYEPGRPVAAVAALGCVKSPSTTLSPRLAHPVVTTTPTQKTPKHCPAGYFEAWWVPTKPEGYAPGFDARKAERRICTVDRIEGNAQQLLTLHPRLCPPTYAIRHVVGWSHQFDPTLHMTADYRIGCVRFDTSAHQPAPAQKPADGLPSTGVNSTAVISTAAVAGVAITSGSVLLLLARRRRQLGLHRHP